MTRARRIAGRLALVVAALALALGAAEAIVRLQSAAADTPKDDAAWRARYRHMNETLYRRSANAELIYEPTPGAAVTMEYGRAAFDRESLRDDREVARAPGDRVRVAMVGDSLVWSEFVALADSLPRRTEEALGPGYEVLNFGVTGYDTTQEAAWYEQTVRAFHPQIVVVVHCMNDEMIMSGPFERYATAAEHAQKDAQDALFARVAPERRETLDDLLARRERAAPFEVLARLLGLWERRRFEARYVDEYLVAGRDRSHRARARAALTRLGTAIRADGATPILILSPVLEAWDRYHWSELHAFVRTEAERAGFTVHDPLPAWRRERSPEELRFPGDNLHYGVAGNQVFGRTIASSIRGGGEHR